MDACCIECGKKATQKCAQCHAVEYCSKECQEADWDDHHADVCFDITNPDREHVREMLEACAPHMLRDLDYNNVEHMQIAAGIAAHTDEETIDANLRDNLRRWRLRLREKRRLKRQERKTDRIVRRGEERSERREFKRERRREKRRQWKERWRNVFGR